MVLDKVKNVREGLKEKSRHFFAREFFRNAIVQWFLIATLFLIAANWVVLAVFVRPVDYPIILHYNVYFGVDLIGSWWQVYLLPLMGTIMFFINTILAYIFYRQGERIASHLLLLASIIVQAGISIGIGGIVLINY